VQKVPLVQSKGLFSKSQISTKLRLQTLMICVAFIVIVFAMFFSFSSIRHQLTEITNREMGKAISNAQTEREFSKLFAKINLFTSTYIGKTDYLKTEGYRLIDRASGLAAQNTDPVIKPMLVALKKQIEAMVAQCIMTNSFYHQVVSIGNEINAEIENLENLIARLFVNHAILGENTSFIEQLLTLTVGYRESLLHIRKLFVDLSHHHYSLPMKVKKTALLAIIDDLSLRLQTITASMPEVARYGETINENILRYREAVMCYCESTVVLNQEMFAVNESRALLSAVLETRETDIAKTTRMVGQQIEETISATRLVVLLLSVLVIVILGLVTNYLIKSSINTPMQSILKSIDFFRQGKLDDRIDLGRKDEWDTIEKGLNEMAADLLRSYTALKESEEKYRDIFENVSDFLYFHDLDGNFIETNLAAKQNSGYTRDELTQLSIKDVIAERYRHLFDDYIKEVTEKGKSEGLLCVVAKDGGEHILEYKNALVCDATGPIGVHGSARDITERRRYHKLIKQSETFLNAIVENIPNMIFVKKAEDLRFVRLNKAGEDLLGYDRQDLLGKNDYDFFPKEEADFFTEKDRAVLIKGTLLDIPEEPIMTRHKGQRILHTKKIPLFAPNGEAEYLLGISEDITEQKQAEEKIRVALIEKEALLKEIHHRVKNNMAVVSSLISLQAKRMEDSKVKAALKESQSRIQSMALVHEHLYQSADMARINLQDYFQQLANSVAGVYQGARGKIDMNIDAKGITLPIDQAVPCGIILNELITNAIKYGFPDHRQGKVDILARQTAEGMLELSVRDNGVGLSEDADLESSKSLGLRLIGLMTDQLHGTLEVTSEGGVKTTIRWPMDGKGINQ